MILYDHLTIETNGIHLHVVQAGPEDGPLVILLHGFPEFWYGWKAQIDALAEQGFRVWAPDQRGYNLSDKPQGIAAYVLDTLAADVIGLIDAAGAEQVFLGGHDWGAAVAWWVALTNPQRLKKLVIANVPHPVVFRQHLQSNVAQMRKSWYMFLFQLPGLPEAILRRDHYQGGIEALRASAKPDTFTDEDFRYYRAAWSQPGALTGMLNWYRALFRTPATPPADSRVHVPTLMLWGAQDTALSVEMAQPSIDLCDDGRLVLFEDATHWVLHDQAAQVCAQMAEFFLSDESLSS
ncbi:MAG: alpha/beta hydrolase [Anaerolineae bacterium]|nr:alpha/beta hydrolase [Anaerolineae bacterium]